MNPSKIPSKPVMKALLASNTLEEISRKYRVHISTVGAWTKLYRMQKSRGPKKLTNHDVVLIRGLYADGMYQATIGEKFEISQSVVSNIVNYKSWKHVA